MRDFIRIYWLKFLGSHIGEDPLSFIDEVKKIFEVMHLTGYDRVDLTS